MTINSSASKTIVLGNGSQTQFTFSFVGVAAAFISVIFTDADGNETLLSQGSGASRYQISLNPPVAGALWGIGGTVTYDPSGTPIATGTSLTIFRTLPLTQAISLQNLISLSTLGNGAETGLDTLEMQLQQVSELFGRAIVAPIVDPDTINLTLPAAAQRANLVLGFDGNGAVVALASPANGTISSAMQPVVNAATLAAGRTAFGLGTMAVEGIGAGLQDDGAGNARVNSAIQEVATNQSVHAANHLDVYAASGALIFTLDRSNTLFNGFTVTIYALTAALSLVPNASDNFTGLASGATFTVPKGCVATISTDGASSGLWLADVTSFGVEPTSTVLTSGTGTYTTKAGCTRLKIRMLGGCGGSGGVGSAATNGGAGGTTTFGSVTAAPGLGGAGLSGNGNSAGGTGGNSGTGTATLRLPGGNGGGGAAVAGFAVSGAGGISALGGSAPSQTVGTGGVLGGLSPSGFGGASGGVSATTGGGAGAGGGGGAGEYVELNITGPNATYAYAVGAAGTAGTGGTQNGAAGSLGIIIIEEFYN